MTLIGAEKARKSTSGIRTILLGQVRLKCFGGKKKSYTTCKSSTVWFEKEISHCLKYGMLYLCVVILDILLPFCMVYVLFLMYVSCTA